MVRIRRATYERLKKKKPRWVPWWVWLDELLKRAEH
jgi:hypothetical protein